jgi:hypothetical protein
MKRCPTCQKEFADSMRFCQTDGTPLVDVQTAPPADDPFKTVVGGSGAQDDPFKTVVGGSGFNQKKDDDILQLPEEPADPMKTMVVSPDELRREIESAPPLNKPTDFPPPKPSEPPKFNEPSLNPPVFGDLSPKPSAPPSDILGSSAPKESTPPPFEPPSDSPFGQPPAGSPFQSPFEQQKSSFEPPSPFDQPKNEPQFDAPKPPPFKEPEPFGQQPSPFDQSPFGQQQQSPFGQAANDPFSQPQAEWNPPPAPVQSWQDQGLGANTPFQPPAAGATGQNNTLAIVSLVCGILSVCLCGLIAGIPAIITGFMAKNNIDANPAEYGGRGMAIAGMILGGISIVFTILYLIFVFASAGLR